MGCWGVETTELPNSDGWVFVGVDWAWLSVVGVEKRFVVGVAVWGVENNVEVTGLLIEVLFENNDWLSRVWDVCLFVLLLLLPNNDCVYCGVLGVNEAVGWSFCCKLPKNSFGASWVWDGKGVTDIFWGCAKMLTTDWGWTVVEVCVPNIDDEVCEVCGGFVNIDGFGVSSDALVANMLLLLLPANIELFCYWFDSADFSALLSLSFLIVLVLLPNNENCCEFDLILD